MPRLIGRRQVVRAGAATHYLKSVAAIGPAEQAFRPIGQGGCKMVQG